MVTRDDLRNIGVIAHVDHGKTTLVDAMLHQAGAFGAHQEVAERVLDSGDLEREKGITILAKAMAIDVGEVTFNVVDTPGHADFGGEVERALAMVDGCLLLVDAAEGPLPQTRFVLRKALARRLPLVLAVNKIDRGDARPTEVVDEVLSLLIDLGADDDQIELPVLFTNARAGTATTDPATPGRDLAPLLDALLATVPPPTYDPDAPLRALVTNLDASPYLGRLALCRVVSGRLRRGARVAWCRADGEIRPAQVSELQRTRALERVSVDEVGPGDLVAVAGIDEVTIGDTLADPDDPRPLPRLVVDEPSLTMTIGINTSPLAGRSGSRLTARLVEARLRAETIGNVSIEVGDTDRPDAWEVRGRGELQLAVLVETMRREGFELTVGKPEVVTRLVDGKVEEPVELLTVDVPDEHVGPATELLGSRKGRMVEMDAAPSGSGRSRLVFAVPARGLIGLRTTLLTRTRGEAVVTSEREGWQPWAGELRTRASGSMVADRRGAVTTYALLELADRGSFFVVPGDEVYEGMVVGEHVRGDDLDVNVAKEKKLTNVRASSGDELVRLAPPTPLGLERALEHIAEDEAVEVTPDAVRLRKVELSATVRGRMAKRAKRGQV